MSLKGKKVIVTGGPTREWIDPVRFISNASSGKMGIAIADAAIERTENVVFVHGPIDRSLVKDKRYRTRGVESTQDLMDGVIEELADGAVLIMSAAPADYAPVEKSGLKIKKNDSELVLRLTKTPDILKTIAQMRAHGRFDGLFTVGFAAETNDIENYALEKLRDKDLDMICLNDVSARGAGFGVDTNIITIFTRSGTRIVLPLMTKSLAAACVLSEIEREMTTRG